MLVRQKLGDEATLAQTVTTPIQNPTAHGTRSHSTTTHIHTLLLFSYFRGLAVPTRCVQGRRGTEGATRSAAGVDPFVRFVARYCTSRIIVNEALVLKYTGSLKC